MDQIKRFCNKYYDYIILISVYGLLHLFIHTDYWDDVGMSAILKSHQDDLFAYFITRWYTWSPAMVIHAVQIVVEALPNYIWKTLDVIMIVHLYHYLVQVINLLSEHIFSTDRVSRTSARSWILLFFLCFPYCMFATAGWMTTTIAYAWTFSIFFNILYHFLLFSFDSSKSFKWYFYLFHGLAILYCANLKSILFSLTVILVFIYYNCKTKSKAFRILFWESMFLITLNAIIILVCPGNRVRNIEDARYHDTAELLDLSLGGQLRMGINSAFYHFISVPNVILFTFCLLLAVCLLFKTSKKTLRICASVPLALDVFWTGYLFFFYTLPNRRLTYIYPDALFQVCPAVEQYLVLISALIMVLLMCWLLAYLTDFSYLSWLLVGFLLVFGLFPCVALGFTTTVSASIMRIASFFYFSMILCACVLIHIYQILAHKIWKYIFYFLAGGGHCSMCCRLSAILWYMGDFSDSVLT